MTKFIVDDNKGPLSVVGEIAPRTTGLRGEGRAPINKVRKERGCLVWRKRRNRALSKVAMCSVLADFEMEVSYGEWNPHLSLHV